ncbi:MAG: hypothetical protein C0404_12510 [Verrucomicrobia bacterium]|nr:hypothetical protein [Verrucomicrobiota bacterium]
MLIDIQKFVQAERPNWDRLDAMIARIEHGPVRRMTLNEVRQFHYLYERASSDLAKLSTFATEPATRRYLESLVARAYGQIHETREKADILSPFKWLIHTFPRTFRRHIGAFYLSCAITMLGTIFGAVLIAVDPSAKEALMPFDNLMESPSQRVQQEQEDASRTDFDPLRGRKAQGSAWYMQNNISVAILTMALGATWGIGTVIELFFTGNMLGSVGMDYILDGQTKFLFGWLLPHGSMEIPAILIAGQAGFILAGAIIGWGTRLSLRQRLRRITGDLATIIGGVALMLVWAGLIEACLSQYHEPIIRYSHKIAFGSVQLLLLTVFLARSGRNSQAEPAVSPSISTVKGKEMAAR